MRMPYLTGIVFLAVIALANYFGFFGETAPEPKEVVSVVEKVATSTPVKKETNRPVQPAATNPTPDSVKVASPAIVSVQYSNGAFSPKTVEIKVGDKVTFVNQTGDRMWVASDPHPSHTIFPDFDQLTSGSSYSFVFTKKGTWNYHNHLSAGAKGAIIVK